jgi:hypothetical protein
VVGPGVLGGFPEPLQLCLQEHFALAWCAGEHGAVVTEQAGWQPLELGCGVKGVNDVLGFDRGEGPRGRGQL